MNKNREEYKDTKLKKLRKKTEGKRVKKRGNPRQDRKERQQESVI